MNYFTQEVLFFLFTISFLLMNALITVTFNFNFRQLYDGALPNFN